jgi:homoaconitate hydratase
MGQTLTARIARAHMKAGPSRPLVAGDVVSLRPRHVMTHDNTAAVMQKFRALGAARILDPRQPVWPMDHDVQNRSEVNLAKYASIEAFALEQGVDFYPPGTGISHQVMVAEGYVVPGSLVVGSDSHSNMYGALGALGTPVVRTDAAAIWATGEFWWQVPEAARVVLTGSLRPGVTGKDVIVTLCGLYNRGEVLNAVVEFAGEGARSLSMDARMTIANMTTEWGALAGIFPVDAVTIEWLRGRHRVLASRGIERFTGEELAAWEVDPPSPDPDALYESEIELDLGRVTPHVSGPDSVQVMRPVAEIARERVAIQKAYLVSCVNSRLEDLEAAARVIRGRRVAPGVSLYVAAASREIQEQAERSGAWGALVDAGARVLPPGCGPCIGLGEGLLEAGETGISATNRNFKGRMGSRDARAYLGSPAVVAESAVSGTITGPNLEEAEPPRHRYRRFDRATPSETVRIEAGFPARIEGRLVFVPKDNLNTDGIYGKDYTYREDLTPADMARVVMENYDPSFAGRIGRGDILVGGRNFGTGSSREQAATALKAAGIAMVIAGSFSQTYLRNAFNNGFVCVACPPLLDHLLERFREETERGDPTLIPGDILGVDFTTGTATLGGLSFRFVPLGAVPQSLIVAGGIEPLVRARLER